MSNTSTSPAMACREVTLSMKSQKVEILSTEAPATKVCFLHMDEIPELIVIAIRTRGPFAALLAIIKALVTSCPANIS